MNTIGESIGKCHSLFLLELGEPEENALRVVVTEATLGAQPDAETLSSMPILAGARAITHGPGGREFEIVWPSYIGYSVRNESYALPEPKHAIRGKGRLFVEFTVSSYLDYLASSTFARNDFPGSIKHWAVYCQNHVIDVASTEEPLITVTTRA